MAKTDKDIDVGYEYKSGLVKTLIGLLVDSDGDYTVEINDLYDLLNRLRREKR